MYKLENNKIKTNGRPDGDLTFDKLAILMDREGILVCHGEAKIVYAKFEILRKAYEITMGADVCNDLCYIEFDEDTIEQGISDLNKMLECTGYARQYAKERGIC